MNTPKTRSKFSVVAVLLTILMLATMAIHASAQSSTIATDGLEFSLNADAASYCVTGYTGSSTEVVIPATHNGLPVTSLAKGAFVTQSGNSEPTISGNGAILLPDFAFFTAPEKITFYAKSILLPDDPNLFSQDVVIVGYRNSTARSYATKYNRTFVEMPSILAADIALGSDITVNYKASIGDIASQNVSMRFVSNEIETVVSGIKNEDTGLYTFPFEGIYPHTMGNDIYAELLVDGLVVDVLKSYSVRQYCLNMLDRINHKTLTDFSDAEYSLLKTLIADLLQYGAAAQIFNDYKTDALVNQGIVGSSSYVSPDISYQDIPFTMTTAPDQSHLISVTLELSNVIRLRFSFATTDVSSLAIKVGNTTYTQKDFIDTRTTDSNGSPIYLLYSEAIYATQIEKLFDISLYFNGTKCQSLQYGVLNYVYRKQNDTNVKLVNLIKSIRCYGESVTNLLEYQNRSGTVALYVANEKLSYSDSLYQALAQKFKVVDRKDTTDSASAVFNTSNYDVVVVVGVDALSDSAAAAMNNFLDNKGRVLLLGGPAMETPYLSDGEYITRAEYREKVISALPANDRQTLINFSKDDLSKPVTSGEKATATIGQYGLTNSAAQLHFSVENLSNFALVQQNVSADLSDANVLSFYAKSGDAQTDVFTLELQGATNSERWRAKLSLTNDWEHYALLPQDFSPIGSAPSLTSFASVKLIKIAFEVSYSKVSLGSHSLYISDLILSKISGDSAFAKKNQYNINGVAPLYEQYPITNAVDISATKEQIFVSDRDYVIPKGKNSLISRHSGITAETYGKDTDIRYIPLLSATDADGLISGHVAWIDLYVTQTSANGNREGAIVGYFGATTEEFYNSDGIAAVVETAVAMSQNAFIVDGGTTESTYVSENDTALAGVKYVSFDSTPVTATVSLYKGNTLLAKYTSTSSDVISLENSIKAIQESFDLSAALPDRAVATISVQGQVIDRVDHNIYYWNPKPEAERSYISVDNGYFKKDGEIINFFGVNYFPSYQGASPTNTEELNKVCSTYSSAFSDGGYNSDAIANDLKRIKQLGMNAIAIQYSLNTGMTCNNLIDFLRICQEMDLYVDISLTSYAYPLKGYHASLVEKMILNNHLNEMDHIIAYDIAWEARVGNYEGGGGGAGNGRHIGRKAWDDDFTAWVKLQYGSISNAELAWGVSLERTSENYLLLTDAMIDDKSGKYSKAVAAYYRFVDDMVSTSIESNLTHMESIVPSQLISFRMSMSGSTLRTANFTPSVFCFDFQSLASSMDFMQPEGYQLNDNKDALLQISFANAYARYAQPDSPVVWKEYGKSVWSNREDGNFYPSEVFLADVNAYYASVLEYCYQSYTSGIFCWWSIGGYRVSEDSDYGIFNPDGSDRGGANGITALLREYAPKFINQGERCNTVHIAIERDDYTGGLFGMFENVKDQLASAYENGKNVTFIDRSQDSNGNYSYADLYLNKYVADALGTSHLAPLRYVNGIVKDCRIVKENGRTYAEITVCNTKQTIWRANTVSIVSSNDGNTVYTIGKDVGYLEDVTFRIDVTGKSRLTLRLDINGIKFGPSFEATIQ